MAHTTAPEKVLSGIWDTTRRYKTKIIFIAIYVCIIGSINPESDEFMFICNLIYVAIFLIVKFFGILDNHG